MHLKICTNVKRKSGSSIWIKKKPEISNDAYHKNKHFHFIIVHVFRERAGELVKVAVECLLAQNVA